MSVLAHELQYHIQRLGNRAHVAQLYRISKDTLRDIHPITDIERFHAGQLISIGGLLVRKCVSCNTARELDQFQSKASNLSGCGNTCHSCLTTQRRASRLHAQYLVVRNNP